MVFKSLNTVFTIGSRKDYRICHLDEFPELLPILNIQFTILHTQSLLMLPWVCINGVWSSFGSSHYLDGWQKDHKVFHIAVTLMAALRMIQLLSARLYLTDYNWQEQVSRSKHVTLGSLIIYNKIKNKY